MQMMKKRAKFLLPISAAALAGGLVLFAAQAPAKPADTEAQVTAEAKVKAKPKPKPKPKPKRCLTGGNYEQQIIDENTMILTDRFNTAMKVTVKGCRLNDMDPLMFEFRGTTQICNPIDLDMSTISSPGFKAKCFVQSVTPVKRGADGAMTDEG